MVDEDEEDVSWMRIEIKVSSKYLFKTGKGCFDAYGRDSALSFSSSREILNFFFLTYESRLLFSKQTFLSSMLI